MEKGAGPQESTSCLEQDLSLTRCLALTGFSVFPTQFWSSCCWCLPKKNNHTLALEPACSFMVLFPELHDMGCSPGVAVLSLLIHNGLHPNLTVHNLRALFFLTVLYSLLWLAVPCHRLWDMLMGKCQEKQPFCSYEALAAKCSQLAQDKRALEAQLEAPMPQLSALESSIEVLYHQLYNSSNQLQLSSPVRSTPPPLGLAGQQQVSTGSPLPSSLAVGWRLCCLPATERGEIGLILVLS